MGIADLIWHGIRLYRHNRWPRERVIAYSEACFRRQLRYAYAHCPFYRQYYAASGIRESDLNTIKPCDLPPIDKDTVRASFDGIAVKTGPAPRVPGLVAEEGLRHDLFVVHSSGSTGKPANFLYSKNALTQVISNFVRLSLGGNNPIRIGDFPIRALFVASVGEGYASVALASSGLREYHSKSLVLNIKDPYQDWAEKIQQFQPTYVAGYPSCLRLIAEMQRSGKISVRPKKIITGGEPLTTDTKTLLLKAFGADIIDYYASSESLLIGAGSSWYEGTYLFDDMNYTEVDSAGRLLMTPLYNDVFPLIRYRLDDVVIGFSRDYIGPLPYTHIDRVIGRSEEVMWFRNPKGEWDFLHPLFIDELEVAGVRDYQFLQTGETALTVFIVPERGTSPQHLCEEARSQVASFLARKGLQNVQIDVEVATELKADEKTGKRKLVVKQGRWYPDAPI